MNRLISYVLSGVFLAPIFWGQVLHQSNEFYSHSTSVQKIPYAPIYVIPDQTNNLGGFKVYNANFTSNEYMYAPFSIHGDSLTLKLIGMNTDTVFAAKSKIRTNGVVDKWQRSLVKQGYWGTLGGSWDVFDFGDEITSALTYSNKLGLIADIVTSDTTIISDTLVIDEIFSKSNWDESIQFQCNHIIFMEPLESYDSLVYQLINTGEAPINLKNKFKSRAIIYKANGTIHQSDDDVFELYGTSSFDTILMPKDTFQSKIYRPAIKSIYVPECEEMIILSIVNAGPCNVATYTLE